jgi:hypothetical protein
VPAPPPRDDGSRDGWSRGRDARHGRRGEPGGYADEPPRRGGEAGRAAEPGRRGDRGGGRYRDEPPRGYDQVAGHGYPEAPARRAAPAGRGPGPEPPRGFGHGPTAGRRHGGAPHAGPLTGPERGEEQWRERRGPGRPDGEDEPAVAPVRRLLSLAISGFAALLSAGLIFGAQTTRASYAVVIFGVQALFVLAWTVATRPPAPRVVAAVGLAAALAADAAAVMTRPASLAPLAYVTAGALLAGVLGQLSRPAGRVRVTESLGSTLVVVLGVVAFSTLIVLTRHSAGTQALVSCLFAAGVALFVARLTDVVLPYPRLAPQVPRGGLGVVLGAMAGTSGAGLAGSLLDGLSIERTAMAGLITAIVAVVVDLSIGYAEASRRLGGDPPTLWLARHMQGPLGAFAFAAPAAYTASALLLVHAL